MINYKEPMITEENNQEYPSASDIMTRQLTTVTPEMGIFEAMHLLLEHNISGAPVLSNNRLVGILSEKDCLRTLPDSVYHNMPGAMVSEYMSRTITTVRPETDVFEIINLFTKLNIRRLPVIDREGNLLGQISRRDVLKAIRKLEQSGHLKYDPHHKLT